MRFVRLEGVQGPAWFNTDHIYSVGTPLKDGVPVIGMAIVHSITGTFIANCPPDEVAKKVMGDKFFQKVLEAEKRKD